MPSCQETLLFQDSSTQSCDMYASAPSVILCIRDLLHFSSPFPSLILSLVQLLSPPPLLCFFLVSDFCYELKLCCLLNTATALPLRVTHPFFPHYLFSLPLLNYHNHRSYATLYLDFHFPRFIYSWTIDNLLLHFLLSYS